MPIILVLGRLMQEDVNLRLAWATEPCLRERENQVTTLEMGNLGARGQSSALFLVHYTENVGVFPFCSKCDLTVGVSPVDLREMIKCSASNVI